MSSQSEIDFAVSQKVAKYKKMEWTGLVLRVNGTDGIDSNGEVHVLNGPSRHATEEEIANFHERRWAQYVKTFDDLDLAKELAALPADVVVVGDRKSVV